MSRNVGEPIQRISDEQGSSCQELTPHRMNIAFL